MTSSLGSQEQYFAERGGDDYFDRNSEDRETPDRDHPSIQLLARHLSLVRPGAGRAAVLGGAGGCEAAAIAEILPGWAVTNVDISPKAIEQGLRTFPHLSHHCLSLSSTKPRLVEEIGPQDLVFVVGVLLWIDRSTFSRAVANIDESLNDGGLLLISDFLPATNRRNPIRHAPEHFTFKQDYSTPFKSLGVYEQITMEVRTAREPADLDVQERRLASHLLRKDLIGLYPVGWQG